MTHNKRFPDIWKILTKHIDFNKKSLLDIGCGYGDLIKAAHDSGATVYGIDKDKELVSKLQNETERLKTGRFFVLNQDVNKWSENHLPFTKSPKIDIISCFSVLPYLDNPEHLISLFPLISPVSAIECQYLGDGPGQIKNDKEMRNLLQSYFALVFKLGATLVDYRNKERSIWLCLR